MDTYTSNGLPFIVQTLLDGQCARNDAELDFKISCSGKCTQLTITWTTVAKNSTPQDACNVDGSTKSKHPKGYKKKTPSDWKRDSLRKKQFIEKKKKPIAQKDEVKKTHGARGNITSIANVASTGAVTRSRSKLCKTKITDDTICTPELGRNSFDRLESDSMYFSPAYVEPETPVPDHDKQPLLSMHHDHVATYSHQLVNWSLEYDNINKGTPKHVDSVTRSDSRSGTNSDSDSDCDVSDCTTDFEENSLGECGLSVCEYGPSVNVQGAHIPSHILECTVRDCGWFVCRGCHRKGGHKRHTRHMKLIENHQKDV